MIQPIILAAGKGTRMRSELPKALYPFLGKPFIRHSVETFDDVAGVRAPLIVVGHQAHLVEEEVADEYKCVLQKEITGTASAVKAALPHVAYEDSVLIANVDHPFLRRETVEKIRDLAKLHSNALIMGVVKLPDFNGYRESFLKFGRIVRNDGGAIERNVEYKDASEEERAITEVNPALYCVSREWLASVINHILPSNASGEYYLTDIIKLAFENGKDIIGVELYPHEGIGVNSPEDAARAETLLRETVS